MTQTCVRCERVLGRGHYQMFFADDAKPGVVDVCSKRCGNAYAKQVGRKQSANPWWHTTNNPMSAMFRL